ncbi:MAG: hypothetical protein ABL936_04340 [Aestuariivirga sp.]
MFKYSAVAAFAILLSTALAIAGSLFDTPGSNPATNRCELYDPNCRPRQLFARPPEPSIRKNPLGNPARKLILPRDQNDQSGTSSPILLLPNSSTRNTLTCSDARRVIRYEGYYNIRTVKCGGKYHAFTARNRGVKYLVNLKVRATTGKIVVVGRVR